MLYDNISYVSHQYNLFYFIKFIPWNNNMPARTLYKLTAYILMNKD